MKKKFTDLVDFVGGKPVSFEGTKSYISTGALKGTTISKEDTELVEYDNRPSRADLEVKKGDILFAKMAFTDKRILIDDDTSNYIYSTGFFAVRAKPNVITTECLYYLLNSKTFKDQKDTNSTGATQKAITNSGLKKIYLKIPNYNNQKEIAEILSNIEKIISFKERQLKEYDQLIKSRFVEIFGDIFINEKSFKVGLFEDYVEQMNIGPFGSALKNEYFVSKEDSYCMVYEQKHAIRKDIDIDRRYVTFDKYKELQRFEIGPGDLIVSCRGTIGECHLLPKNAPMGIIHPSLMMIKPKKHVNGRFLLYLLEKILERQLDSGSGVKMAIQAKELAKVKTIIPEKNIQDDYVFFVEQVDKLKFEVLKLLGELR